MQPPAHHSTFEAIAAAIFETDLPRVSTDVECSHLQLRAE